MKSSRMLIDKVLFEVTQYFLIKALQEYVTDMVKVEATTIFIISHGVAVSMR